MNVPPADDGEQVLHILWMNGGLSCDGESVALTAATQPSIEEIVAGALPGLPPIDLHWPYFDFNSGPDQGGDSFIEWWHRAARGELDPFILIVEGSVPDETNKPAGYWSGFGNDPATGQPITATEWLDRLAPKATAIMAVGTCAAYGGVHAMAGNPTGAMGVPDYLGWDWKSKAGLPIVCVPGCPTHPDNLAETILHLLYQVSGQAPEIALDESLRPRWLFETTVHSGCDRASFYDQSDFATGYGSTNCLVKVGCWGQVVRCNVAKRGWINGVGGCPNVGGICIACTMPGFPDKFMPFMEEPAGAAPADAGYAPLIRTLRGFTLRVTSESAR
ncbi:hydrogenase expression protein HypE [Paractinoplanes rishiriensis]|uniref:Hydrogenase small subunit n=1 Tax=Paractinoplanes rishiriensis TaxID=1050105 RepID=A0A919MZ04_9ACTN|nr:hydrogenase expression protein HypE [Actinoplanes rishiriensis]GIF00600.1 hydrogenase small subunit [Actinoplanes rishiriensis]